MLLQVAMIWRRLACWLTPTMTVTGSREAAGPCIAAAEALQER